MSKRTRYGIVAPEVTIRFDCNEQLAKRLNETADALQMNRATLCRTACRDYLDRITSTDTFKSIVNNQR